MIVVYIASPYTIGNTCENVSKHLHVADTLIGHGFCVIAPLLFHYIDIIHPRPKDVYMQIDFELIKRCDVLIRLEGESAGADEEIQCARAHDIHVVYSVQELIQFRKSLEK